MSNLSNRAASKTIFMKVSVGSTLWLALSIRDNNWLSTSLFVYRIRWVLYSSGLAGVYIWIGIDMVLEKHVGGYFDLFWEISQINLVINLI